MRSPLGYPLLIGPRRSAGGSNELKLEPGRRSGVAGAGSAPCPDCAVASIAKDPSRATRSSSEGGGLFLDYSKNCITAETLRLLLRLAEVSGVAARRDAMFRCEKINNTEERAVLHMALRAPCGTRIELDGKDVVPQVWDVLDRMAGFVDRVRSGGDAARRSRSYRHFSRDIRRTHEQQ